MTAETIMIRGSFVTEQSHLRQRRMDSEFLFIVKNRF